MELIIKQIVDKKNLANFDTMKMLDKLFDFPSKSFKTIHVTGTNGKGSVSTKIAKVLSRQGHKTGLFTSPHIETCRERIQIDFKMIEDSDGVDIIKKILDIVPNINFFELLTMTAFIYFRSKCVKFAIIEVGVGGKLDSTNIVNPELSVITNVTIDHVEILGDNIYEIGEHKAGIIKYETPVVVGYRAALQPIFRSAFECKAPLYILCQEPDWWKENDAIARKALSLITPEEIGETFHLCQPCRLEVIDIKNLTLVFDIAHNVDAIEKLFTKLKTMFKDRTFSVIFAMSGKKEIKKSLTIIQNYTQSIFAYESGKSNLLKQDEVKTIANVSQLIQLSIFVEIAKRNRDIVIITGSSYIMHDLKLYFLGNN